MPNNDGHEDDVGIDGEHGGGDGNDHHGADDLGDDDCRVNKGVEQGVGGVGNPKAIGKEISGEEPTGADSPTGGDLPQMVVYIPHARAHLLLRPYSIFAT